MQEKEEDRRLNISWGEESFRISAKANIPNLTHMPSLGRRVVRVNARDRQHTFVIDDTISDEDGGNISLKLLTDAIANAGFKHGAPAFTGTFAFPKEDPDIIEMNTLIRRRRLCRDSVQRQNISLSIYRLRTRIRARRADLEHQNAIKFGRAPQQRRATPQVHAIRDYRNQDILLDDPEDIEQNVFDFYLDLFSCTDPLPLWITQEFDEAEFGNLPRLARSDLRSMIEEFKGGKTSARDNIVAEMLKELPDDVLDIIISIFTLETFKQGC